MVGGAARVAVKEAGPSCVWLFGSWLSLTMVEGEPPRVAADAEAGPTCDGLLGGGW